MELTTLTLTLTLPLVAKALAAISPALQQKDLRLLVQEAL